MQEERRLFYVGMTRARKGLFFVWSDSYGGAKKKRPSRFLSECGIDRSSPLALPVEALETKKVSILEPKRYSLPSHFSYTQLAAFQNCPLQYKFAHILKIPRRGKPAFSFGKTMHQTLYDFFKMKLSVQQGDLFGGKQKAVVVSFKDLLAVYDRNWIDEWYENKENQEKNYQQGKRSLKIFYDNFLRKEPKVLFIDKEPALEQSFNLKIGSDVFIGKIDRIDQIDDGVEIIDYKTGLAKEKLSAQDKEQLLIYQIAVEEVLGLKVKSLTYNYLQDGKSLSFLGSVKDKEKQREKIISQIEQMKKTDFSPTPGFHCKFCDFKDICEHARETF